MQLLSFDSCPYDHGVSHLRPSISAWWAQLLELPTTSNFRLLSIHHVWSRKTSTLVERWQATRYKYNPLLYSPPDPVWNMSPAWLLWLAKLESVLDCSTQHPLKLQLLEGDVTEDVKVHLHLHALLCYKTESHSCTLTTWSANAADVLLPKQE